MKLKLFLVAVLFLFGSFLRVNGQIEGYIKSKAKTATNRAASNTDKEVDSQINKAVDKEFNKLKGKILDKDEKPSEAKTENKSETGEINESPTTVSESKSSSKSSGDDAMSKAIMGKMGINMERPANMKDSYEYTGNIKMDVETWNYDGESEGVVAYTTQYSESNNGFAMEFNDKEKGNSYMIFDYDNKLMLILADDGKDKSGFASPLEGYQSDSVSTAASAQTSEANAENYYSAFKKTGKTKTIAGYKCEEYYFENEEDISSYWIATDLPAELWAKMGTSSIFSSVYMGRTSGYVMESDHQSKTSKERTHMIVKEVNQKQPGRINTEGYNNIMNMQTPPPAKEKESKDEKK